MNTYLSLIDEKHLPQEGALLVTPSNEREFYFKRNVYAFIRENDKAIATNHPVTFLQIRKEAGEMAPLYVYPTVANLDAAFEAQAEEERKAEEAQAARAKKRRARKKKKEADKQPVEETTPAEEEDNAPVADES